MENVLDTLPALAESTVPRLAYINSDTLMARYDMVTKMTAEMDAKMKSLQKDFDKKKNQFQKDVEYFQTQVELGSLSEQSSQEIYQKLMERQQELYDLQENYANQVAELEQKNLPTVYDKVTNYLSRVNENNKYYDFIFINTGIINVNNAYDITETVAAGLNEEYHAQK
ncbi:MAG: OmpH family outer membrane protein [Bacteroidales bacterium]|nr:OmpH family outer membrane protein [Bacteroidales bacterium]